MLRVEKENVVKEVSDRFQRSKATFVVDFKGLNVEQVTTIRKKLRTINAEMKVVRNTLALRALKDTPQNEEALKDHLVGTNALVFSYEDISASAKTLADFAKDFEQLQLKAGVMDGTALSKDKISYLATLPSKDVLRAQLLGVFAAPMTKMVGVMAAVPGGFARVLNAYKQTKE